MARERVRVLVEHENPRVLAAQCSTLARAGFVVDGCCGPRSAADGRCPLVEEGSCARADVADVIVNGLPIGDLRVYAAERTVLPDRPVVLGLTPEEQEWVPTLDDATAIVERNISGSLLVDAVRSVLRRR